MTKHLSEIISQAFMNALQVFLYQANQNLVLALQRIPKYPNKVVSINSNFSGARTCALLSVFQNLRVSSYKWRRKAKFDYFFPYFQISGSVETGPETAITNGTGTLKNGFHVIQHTVTHVTGKLCLDLTAS